MNLGRVTNTMQGISNLAFDLGLRRLSLWIQRHVDRMESAEYE